MDNLVLNDASCSGCGKQKSQGKCKCAEKSAAEKRTAFVIDSMLGNNRAEYLECLDNCEDEDECDECQDELYNSSGQLPNGVPYNGPWGGNNGTDSATVAHNSGGSAAPRHPWLDATIGSKAELKTLAGLQGDEDDLRGGVVYNGEWGGAR